MKKILLQPTLDNLNLSEFEISYTNSKGRKKKLHAKATLELTIESENIRGEKTYSCTFGFCDRKDETIGSAVAEELISFAHHTPGFQFPDSTAFMLSTCTMEELLVHMVHQTGEIHIAENTLTLYSRLLRGGEVSVELSHELLAKLLA